MSPKVGGIVGRSVRSEEPLGGGSALKAKHFSHASSDRKMRVFGPIAFSQASGSMTICKTEMPKRGAICDDRFRLDALVRTSQAVLDLSGGSALANSRADLSAVLACFCPNCPVLRLTCQLSTMV